jgi:cell volume regulation protein A
MQIGMFLLLGLLVDPSEMWKTAIAALLIGIFMMLCARPLSVVLSLLPFKNINLSSKAFISWVGLRGAVPIIFAIYPVVENVPGSKDIFNIVFFITLLSMVLQGGTIALAAKKLKLLLPPAAKSHFDVELPDEAGELSEMTVTPQLLEEKGDTLQSLGLPKGVLVMLVKRGDKYMVPDGSLRLVEGDHLLIVASSDFEEKM